MILSPWLRDLFSRDASNPSELILNPREQIKAWRKADRKMAWGIRLLFPTNSGVLGFRTSSQ